MVRLKRTEAFNAVYRRGRWVHGAALSVGALANGQRGTRVGLRTRRGLKGAVERNRLKRQVRVLFNSQKAILRSGFDVVIVIHPNEQPLKAKHLGTQLESLCKRAGVLN